MNGSGVSVLEIWVVILRGGRVGPSPIGTRDGELYDFEGSSMRLRH